MIDTIGTHSSMAINHVVFKVVKSTVIVENVWKTVEKWIKKLEWEGAACMSIDLLIGEENNSCAMDS